MNYMNIAFVIAFMITSWLNFLFLVENPYETIEGFIMLTLSVGSTIHLPTIFFYKQLRKLIDK